MTQGLFRCLSFNIFENLKRPPQQQGTSLSNEVHLIRIFSIILLPGFFSTFPHCMRLGLQVAPTSLSSRSGIVSLVPHSPHPSSSTPLGSQILQYHLTAPPC